MGFNGQHNVTAFGHPANGPLCPLLASQVPNCMAVFLQMTTTIVKLYGIIDFLTATELLDFKWVTVHRNKT